MTVQLTELDEKIRRCVLCPLHSGRTHAVPGEGNPNADIVFIGEGPGQREDTTGKPFIGSAGKFLTTLLTSISLRREDVYITNIVKCRPPGNRDPFPNEIETCTQTYLVHQISLIGPKLIVTLGRHSMHFFLPADFQISKVHGRPFRRSGQVYLPLYHPAAALYHQKLRATLEEDFQKIPIILKKINSVRA